MSVDKCSCDNPKDVKCDKCSCDLCETITVDPCDPLNNGARLVTVKVKVTNICFDKKVAIAVIIFDQCHRILAFRGFTKKLRRPNECDKSACGTIERKLVFILPDDEKFDPSKLKIVVKANYIYPCK